MNTRQQRKPYVWNTKQPRQNIYIYNEHETTEKKYMWNTIRQRKNVYGQQDNRDKLIYGKQDDKENIIYGKPDNSDKACIWKTRQQRNKQHLENQAPQKQTTIWKPEQQRTNIYIYIWKTQQQRKDNICKTKQQTKT